MRPTESLQAQTIQVFDLAEYRHEVFDDDEVRILEEQAEEALIPGGESVAFKIWRCAHCRQIRPWHDGGDSWTGPGVFSPAERDFLGQCCDTCWHLIVSTLGAAYKRAKDRYLRSVKLWP